MIHLHGWSHYSMLSALGTPKDILQRAKELNQTAIAITDNNAGYGLLEFYEKAGDIKPILGVDINFSYDGKNMMNIVLLSKTYEGYENLIKIISIANTTNFKQNPYIDMENLKRYSKGIIAISGGNGEIEKLILGGEKKEMIVDKIREYQQIFNNEFYLEFLTYDYELYPDRKKIEDFFQEIIDTENIEAVVTSNYRYLKEEDKDTYDILLCVKNNWKYYEENRPRVKQDFHIMSEDDVKKVLTKNKISDKLQAKLIDNTHKIANSIDCKIPLHQLLFPKYVVPDKYANLYKKI